MTHDPYKVYIDESILNESPVGLIVALYEGAIEASVAARKHLAAGDIMARTKAINKIVNILSELMRVLDDEKGGEFSKNLRRLYLYMQGRVLEAQMKRKAAPLQEFERLMSTVLEGWKVAERKLDPAASFNATSHALASWNLPLETSTLSQHDHGYADSASPYSSYF